MRNIEQKFSGINMHTCNPAWMSVTLSQHHTIKLQLPMFIRYQRKIEEQPVVSANTVEFSELALMIHQLRDIYLANQWPTKIVPYDVQFKSMVDALEKGVDKKQIIMITINYIEKITEDLRKKGVKLNIATKQELIEKYVKDSNKEFESLAHLIDSIKRNYEQQGYIVQLPSYDDQMNSMKQQLSQGKSKSAIILDTLNKMENEKLSLARNGVSIDAFPNQEALEKYYIGNDKDYIELAKLCDFIYQTSLKYGISTSALPYQKQLNWIKELETQGNSKEQILRALLTIIEKAKREFDQRKIPNSLESIEKLYQRYSVSYDTVFTSLAQLVDHIRTFYLTNRLNTHLLPYDTMLKVMKDAYQNGTEEKYIVTTTLNMIEEAREDLNSKGYPIALPTKEQLYSQYHIDLKVDKQL